MIVAAIAASRAVWPYLISRTGLLVIAAVAVYVFYEGVPAGTLRNIPGIQHVIPEGRVASEARRAREGYVQEARLIAAEAKLAETQRQLDAGRKALEGYAELLAAEQARNAADDVQGEKDRSENEKRLDAAGRSRPLDDSDIKWLRR